MHYSNGRLARPGDLVKGTYEGIKHEIIGVVTSVSPGSDTCNCVVHAVVRSATFGSTVYMAGDFKDGQFVRASNGEVKAVGLTCNCKDFVALDPATGDVLPPEEAPAEDTKPAA